MTLSRFCSFNKPIIIQSYIKKKKKKATKGFPRPTHVKNGSTYLACGAWLDEAKCVSVYGSTSQTNSVNRMKIWAIFLNFAPLTLEAETAAQVWVSGHAPNPRPAVPVFNTWEKPHMGTRDVSDRLQPQEPGVSVWGKSEKVKHFTQTAVGFYGFVSKFTHFVPETWRWAQTSILTRSHH